MMRNEVRQKLDNFLCLVVVSSILSPQVFFILQEIWVVGRMLV